jgi:hypothetical protein
VKFLEHSFIIGLLFGIHFGLNLLALLLPHHLLIAMLYPEKSWNFINVVLDVANVVLWLVVFVLAVRLARRNKPKKRWSGSGRRLARTVAGG